MVNVGCYNLATMLTTRNKIIYQYIIATFFKHLFIANSGLSTLLKACS